MSSRLLALLGCAALAALLAPPARAHETRHQVARGRALAVQALEGDDPMAGAAWQVFSPADPARPFQEGRTDRQGWLSFVPDAPGRWRVKVVEEDGHGLEVEVEAGPAPQPAGAPLSTRSPLGTLLGLAAVGAVFAALLLGYRRRGARG